MADDVANSLKAYEVFRDRIKHQDTLIANRVQFFLLMQSALLVAWSSWDRHQAAQADKSLKSLTSMQDTLFGVFVPLAGWILSFALLSSIYFAFCSIEACVRQYRNLDLHEEFFTGDRRLKGVYRIAPDPEEFGSKQWPGKKSLPPMRSGWKVHFFGHLLPWAVTGLCLFLWPFILAGVSVADLFAGRANLWWYVFEVASLGGGFRAIWLHISSCKSNDVGGTSVTKRTRNKGVLTSNPSE